LKSIRGVDGGYYLQRPAGEITLLHIIEATDGPLTPVVPPLDGISEQSRARLHAMLQDINADACRRMAAVKLTDLRSAKPREYAGSENRSDQLLSKI
jgi:DNA-binding IscR family transcriptional regulator